jgi:hypothetical protein
MMSASSRGIRSLFVISNDHGELALALFFLQGQAFAPRSSLLLPDRLYAINKEVLSIDTGHYSSVEDILEWVRIHEPELVFLFSGYLLTINRIFSHREVERLVQSLVDRGIGIVTSDPFLRLASKVTPWQIRVDVPQRSWLRFFPGRLERELSRDLVRVSHILQDVTHIYPGLSVGLTRAEQRRSVTFFNPTIAEGSAARIPASRARPAHGALKSWLFILAATDLRWQRRVWGEQRFTRMITRRIEQTLLAGRRPVLVVPPDLIKGLSKEASRNAELVPFCPFPEMISRLIEAEYAFYWNVFSCSMLVRLARGQPVFFFDRGHMARVIRPIYDWGLRFHFGNWSPVFLDANEPLTPERLAKLALTQQGGFEAIRRKWQMLPSPQDVVDRLGDDSRRTKNPRAEASTSGRVR